MRSQFGAGFRIIRAMAEVAANYSGRLLRDLLQSRAQPGGKIFQRDFADDEAQNHLDLLGGGRVEITE
jgi:hypothetical protein